MPALSATDLVARTSELVSLPDIYLRVKAVINDPESAVTDLAAVIEYNPALTARVLKLANSPFFGLVSRVDTVHRATNLLGAIQIHNLVLATAVADAFADTEPRNFNLHDFWVDSIHCGLLAKQLALASNMREADRFFVCGLLHDIGHLIIDQAEPERLSAVLAEFPADDVPLHELERERIGTDYAEVGATLMRSWSFPKPLIASVQFQNEPGGAGQSALDASLVHLSTYLLERNAGMPVPFARAIDPQARELLALDEALLADIGERALQELDECVEALFPSQAGSGRRRAG